jgi:pyruvate/2-oxoglutarate dehydrogenase complex dihydrolipoamide acyltransferase (E2) component
MSHRHDILLPDIGAGPHTIRVVQWLVDRGSDVLAGDRILEVAATGVLFVVSAPETGVLTSQLVGVDAVVQSGDRLGVIEEAESADLDS